MKFVVKNLSLSYFTLLILLLSFFVPTPLQHFEIYAQGEVVCEERLNDAEAEYKAGHWPESIDLINQCLAEQNLTEAERGRAYRLLGLVYIAIELEKEANDAVKNLLIMVPNYKIDPDRDPPQLKKIIDDIVTKLKPSVTSITPDNVDVESEGFTLTVNGSDFVYGSVIRFNGVEKATTYVGPNQLTAVIPSSDLMKEGKYDITVFSPIHEGRISNEMKFSVNASSNVLTWVLIGGGAAVAAIVAIVALGGSDESTPPPPPAGAFPTPPGRP